MPVLGTARVSNAEEQQHLMHTGSTPTGTAARVPQPAMGTSAKRKSSGTTSAVRRGGAGSTLRAGEQPSLRGRQAAPSSVSTSKLSARQIIRKYKASIKPRTWLYTVFALVELVMVGSFALSVTTSGTAVHENYREAATDALGGVHEGYTKKVFQMRNLVDSTKKNWYLQEYLYENRDNTVNDEIKATVLSLLQHIGDTYKIEYVYLLDGDGKVLMSTNKQHVGDVFDPQGVVTSAKSKFNAVWTYGRLTYEELLDETPPTRWDRESQLDESFKGGHPYNYRGDSVIRWVANAIRPADMVTLEIISETAPPFGFLVLGDLANGHSATTSLISQTVGGFGGVFTHREDAGAAEGEQWVTASATVTMQVQAQVDGENSVMNVLVQGFSPYNAYTNLDAFFDNIQHKAEADLSSETGIINPYMMAARKWHDDDEVEPADGRPDLLLARGVVMDLSLTTGFIVTQWGMVAAILALDVFTLFLATWLFLSPLEAMGRRVRSGQRVDITFLKNLTRRKKFVGLVAAVAIGSLGVGVAVQVNNSRNFDKLIATRSAAEPGSAMLAYRQGPDQYSRIMMTMQAASAACDLLADPTNAERQEFMRARLAKLEPVVLSEFVVLLNNANQIVTAPHNMDLVGETWNPAGIVNDTIWSGKRFTRTGIIPSAELERFNAIRKYDRYVESTPDSALDPWTVGQEVLIRWIAVPMWIKGPKTTGVADGVLLAGDIVNGKTRIVERANKMTNHGYSAVYFYNSSESYQIATGVMRASSPGSENITFDVDIELPETAWLDKLRLTKKWIRDEHYTVTRTMHFKEYPKKYFVSARCVNKNVVYQDYGADTDSVDWQGEPLGDCMVYLVTGLPWDEVDHMLQPSYSWAAVFVFFCCVKIIAMTVLCYRAYLPFKKIVLQNRFVQGGGQGVTSPAMRGSTSHTDAGATLTATRAQ